MQLNLTEVAPLHRSGSPVGAGLSLGTNCAVAAERSLIAEVLKAAIDDFHGRWISASTVTPSERARWKLQARLWFADTGREPFSFRWCCEALDIDPAAFLARLEPPEKNN